ncbi:hypothetical protein ACFXI3_16115 [Amycolatopsis sp. NPDC059235]|uniref:hypothetical protein n=1 Tax=Amycolatopsis sp. NPDC059235 TaxID=3346782 RepID=UPI003671C4BA
MAVLLIQRLALSAGSRTGAGAAAGGYLSALLGEAGVSRPARTANQSRSRRLGQAGAAVPKVEVAADR